MFKRLSALLFCFILLFSSALAQEGSFATYQLPQGAQVSYITQAGQFDIPQGLEPMYSLMQHATLQGDVYLMRMPNGRALASVGCSPVEKEYTAEELGALWPEIARGLRKECEWVNDDPACAAVEKLYGFDMLHIRTQLSVGGENALLLDAEAFAFCHDGAVLEVWAVQPAQPVYLYDERAAEELKTDSRALKLFLSTLDFTGEVPALQSEEYTDPKGRFSMHVLSGSVIITPETPIEQVSEARSRFVAANDEGADNAFDQMMTDVYEQRVTLILPPEMNGAIEVFVSQERDFAEHTPEMLVKAAESIRRSLNDRFGIAVTLDADSRAQLSQLEHALICYWLRSGQCNLQLDVLACVTGDSWLCEVDVFTVNGDQKVRSVLHSLLSQTLRYTVD